MTCGYSGLRRRKPLKLYYHRCDILRLVCEFFAKTCTDLCACRLLRYEVCGLVACCRTVALLQICCILLHLWHGDNLREMLRLLAAAGATPHQHKIPAACSFLAMLIRWPCLNCGDCGLVPKIAAAEARGIRFLRTMRWEVAAGLLRTIRLRLMVTPSAEPS